MTQTQAVEVRRGGPVDQAISVDEAVAQMTMINDARERIMQQDVHYGKIPGTKKDTLLKAGAEKLSLLFQLRCVIDPAEVFETFSDDGHYSATVYARMLRAGEEIATGVGSCTTRESRYAFRNEQQTISTGVAVPKSYWKDRDAKQLRKAIEEKPHNLSADVLSGALSTRKLDEHGEPNESGSWTIVVTTGSTKIPNPNLPDVYNTVLKMAKKRAYVDGVLTATATSEFFTQDLEDMERAEVVRAAKTEKKKTDEHVPEVSQESEAQRQVDNSQLAQAQKDDGLPFPKETNGRQAKPWDDLKKGSKQYDLAKIVYALEQHGVHDDDLELFAQLASGKPVAKMTHDDIKRLTEICKRLAETPVADWPSFINWYASLPNDGEPMTIAKSASMFLEHVNA